MTCNAVGDVLIGDPVLPTFNNPFVSVRKPDAGAAFVYSGRGQTFITSLQGNTSDELGTSVAG
ncbi:MAG: hypothetical protein ABEH58_04565 [Haloplanus sp.]